MFDAINTALTGLSTATARLNIAATNIANFGSDNDAPAPPTPLDITPDDTLSSDLVTLKTSQFLYSANAAVVRASNHMLGTLLDILDHDDRRSTTDH